MNTRIQQHVARAATSYLPQGTHTSTQHEVHTNTRPCHAHRFPAQHSCCNTKPHPHNRPVCPDTGNCYNHSAVLSTAQIQPPNVQPQAMHSLFFLPVSTTPRRRSDTDGNNMEGTFLLSASYATEWGGCQKRTHPLRLTLELHLVYVATIYLARSYGRAKPRLSRMPQPQARLAAAHASHHFSSSQLYPNTLKDPTPLELSPRSVWITL